MKNNDTQVLTIYKILIDSIEVCSSYMYNTVQQAKQIKVILLTRFQCRSLPDITKGTNINSTAFKNSSSLVLRATSLAVVIEHASILFRAGCQTETCGASTCTRNICYLCTPEPDGRDFAQRHIRTSH